MKIKVFALSYASFDSDNGLFVDTLGVSDNYESVAKALKDNVSQDIKDGDPKENWKIEERKAKYCDVLANEYKEYSIKEL